MVKLFGAAFARRNQLQPLPVVELLVGDVQEALELTPAKSFGCSHVIVASISSGKSLISTALLVADFGARLTPQKRQQSAALHKNLPQEKTSALRGLRPALQVPRFALRNAF